MMEDSWEICPYCPTTGYATGSLARTKLESDPLPATRLETPAGAAAARGKTVLITERKKPPVLGWLVALNGQHRGEDFRVREGQNTLGTSSDCEIVLRDETVSARHASLRYKDSKFYLSDLDSSNGTFLNDSVEPVARVELKDNDVIRLGDVSFKFKCL
jgi:hypothetical protein